MKYLFLAALGVSFCLVSKSSFADSPKADIVQCDAVVGASFNSVIVSIVFGPKTERMTGLGTYKGDDYLLDLGGSAGKPRFISLKNGISDSATSILNSVSVNETVSKVQKGIEDFGAVTESVQKDGSTFKGNVFRIRCFGRNEKQMLLETLTERLNESNRTLDQNR